MNLTGDRNQCQCCKEYFNSTFSFEKHRVGEFGVDRRCLSVSEMEAKGMAVNGSGFWVSALMVKQPFYNTSGSWVAPTAENA